MSSSPHSANLDQTNGPAPWYKQFWPWFLIMLPGSVVIGGITMIFIAFQHADSLVDDDYYRSGLAINQNLGAQSYARQLGLQARLHFLPQQQRVKMELVGALSALPETVLLAFSHPTSAAEDFTLELQHVGGNSYVADSSRPIAGRWYFKIYPVTADTQQSSWLLQAKASMTLFGEHKYYTIDAGARGES